MKDLFTSLITLILFVVALGLFYAALTVSYPSVFINLVMIIISIFVLLQACERVDKALELGKYADDEQNNEES